MLTIMIILIFAATMLWAAYSDLTSYRLSNKLCLTVALLYPIYLIATVMDDSLPTWEYILISLAIAFIILIIGMVLFALNILGGGDVKLIPAVALWAGPLHIFSYLMVTSVIGGIIAMIIIVNNRVKTSKYYKSSGNLNLSMSEKIESAVPYGIGIAGGGLFVAYKLIAPLIQG